jgi:hypothetical protein
VENQSDFDIERFRSASVEELNTVLLETVKLAGRDKPTSPLWEQVGLLVRLRNAKKQNTF